MTPDDKVGYFLRLWLHVLMLNSVQCVKVKVAVYEHVLKIYPKAISGIFTRDEAFAFMKDNLNIIEAKAAEASKQGARVVIFPEYGITGFYHLRNTIMPFLENIPDGSLSWNPCEEPDRFKNTQVLKALSCRAKTSSIYIVANMGDIKPCSTVTDPFCPRDGRYQFNTNVVFDDKGRLIARYHKRNMYDETPLFDPAPKNEFVFFETDFGRFGTVICFDLLHENPTQILIQQYGIRNLLVTSAWNVLYPFVLPVQMYAGISKRNNITIAVSNARSTFEEMAGSGIFGNGVDASTNMDYNSFEGPLLVREIDTFDTRDTAVKPEDPPLQGFGGKAANDFAQYVNSSIIGRHFLFGINMSFVMLTGDSGRAFTCYDKVCCAVEYDFNVKDETELFVLSASDFSMFYPGYIHMQFCAIHRCATKEPASCGDPVDKASSTLSYIRIQGFLDHGVVFPFLSTSSDGQHHTMELDKYNFSRSKAIIESDAFDQPMLAIVVFNSVSEEYEQTHRDASSEAQHSVPSNSLQCMCISFLFLFQLTHLLGV